VYVRRSPPNEAEVEVASSVLPPHSTTASLEDVTMRAVTRRLVPFLFLLYVVCFLDRVNVGFAALQMNRDLGLSAAAYGLGAGILFLGYALFEIPSNVILARMGARRWIARIAVTWGLLSSAMMFVEGPRSFYVLRFLLGVAEAGFFPGIIFYLGTWFPAARRAWAISWFMTAIPMSAVIGGPVSGALLSLNGRLGLAGWQWLFLLEGLPSVLLGVVAYFYLTDRPADASWLDPAQRAWLTRTLGAEQARNADRHRIGLREALAHGVVWQLGLVYALGGMGTYGLALWLPQIVKGLTDASDFGVGVITGAASVLGVVAMVLVARHSDRTGERCAHVAACGLVAALGFLVSAYIDEPLLALVALGLAAAGTNGRFGPFWALPPVFLRDEAAAGGIALINSLGALAGFAAPYAIGIVRDRTGSFRGGLILLALTMAGSSVLALRLRRSSLLTPALQSA
jgi:ACS family tartrate transporter-like MFS transporter